MSSNPAKTVYCPTCGKAVPWMESQLFKPFCSERCKLIDLGEWANAEKIIQGDPITQDADFD